MQELQLLIDRLDGVSVLYVEDDKSQRDINAETFSKLFHLVDVAEDGSQGVEKYKEYFSQNDSFYDLVITDILMPHLDGIKMSEVLTELNPEQNIVVLSAHNEMDHLRTLIDLGVDAYMNKPIEFSILCNVMEKVSQRIYIKQKNEQYVREIERLNKKLMNKNRELELQIQNSKPLETKVTTIIEPLASETHKDITLEIRETLLEDIPDLQDIHDDLDHLILICVEKHIYSDNYEKISTNLTRFSGILSCYNLLHPLSTKIEELSSLLRSTQPPEDKLEDIFDIIESFINSLGSWIKVWEQNKVNNISYFNDSMITDIETIINLWNNVEVKGEIEFFI